MLLKANTSVTLRVGPFLDETDAITPQTGLSLLATDVHLSKNGGAFAAKNDANAPAHDEDGWYSIQLDATDTNTEGTLVAKIAVSGSLQVYRFFNIVSEEVYDALNGSFASVLATFATVDTGEASAISGSVAELSQGSGSTVIVNPVVGSRAVVNAVTSPVQLEMFKKEAKSFSITIQDSAGDAVDLSSKELRFVVHTVGDTVSGLFQVEEPDITVSGASNEIATIPVSPVQSTQTPSLYQWELWDVTSDSEQVLAHGPFYILTAIQEVS